uniref:Uncharacterized protein n=1 Tax=Romanomermis culicivorax TaxID=13658 RepID=A0A915JK00_ROMCU
ELHPGDLKLGVENLINKLLTPIRSKFEQEPLKSLIVKAYPPPGKPVSEKKIKKKHGKEQPKSDQETKSTTVNRLEEDLAEKL